MNTIIKQIQTHIHLSENELVIIEYIIDHLDEIPKLTSRELAKKTYTSATSIMRFIKKLGYGNYNEFRYQIAFELKNLEYYNMNIVSSEHIVSLINKSSQIEINAIQKTKEMLSIDEFKEIIMKISKATYIDIIANDANARLAQYASHCINTLGKIVNVYHETNQQLNCCLNIMDDHIVIIISKFALDPHIANIAMTLHKKKRQTILITSNQDN